jgi:hypothetical protein
LEPCRSFAPHWRQNFATAIIGDPQPSQNLPVVILPHLGHCAGCDTLITGGTAALITGGTAALITGGTAALITGGTAALVTGGTSGWMAAITWGGTGA